MVHMKTKCPKLGYGDEDVKKLKTSFKRIGETLIEKVETIRTVMGILEVRTKKFDKNISCNGCNPFTFTLVLWVQLAISTASPSPTFLSSSIIFLTIKSQL